jgi:peptidoglycan hydrolase-like protein with peptidoglycan-binding domain
MADVQVTLSLPVLRKSSDPESGPTVVQHLQLMLNERGGFPILNVDGQFGSSTEQSVRHYQQNENLDTSKNPNSPQLGCNEINDLALARGAPGRVFRTLQVDRPASGN